MAKIPFEASFAGAYQFLFRRILSIIGTLWLPMLVACGLSAAVVYLIVPHAWWQGQFPVFADASPNPAVVWSLVQPCLAAFVPIMLIIFVFGSMMMVGFMRLALGQKERCFVFFSLGGDVWRLLAAWILSFLVMMLIVGMAVGGGVILAAVGRSLLHGYGILLVVLYGIAAFCFYIYTAVRLTFLLPAVVMAEHKIGLERSWELGRGNFWRMFGLYLAIFIPVAIVASVLQQIILASPAMLDVMKMAQLHVKPDSAAVLHAVWLIIPWYVGVMLLQHIVTYGLIAGATAKAYLALTEVGEGQG